MGKLISTTELSETLSISEQTDGFWLWDATREMNLSMRAKSVQEALVEALTYYQKRLAQVEQEHASLSNKVDAFVSQFIEDED
jgi:hypothetical protein